MGENEEYDFQTKLKVEEFEKVVDQSFNQDQYQDGVKRYLHVSIFTKTIEDAPKVGNLGDILYLKRFQVIFKRKFYRYELGGQVLLSAKYQGHFSHWRLYSNKITQVVSRREGRRPTRATSETSPTPRSITT